MLMQLELQTSVITQEEQTLGLYYAAVLSTSGLLVTSDISVTETQTDTEMIDISKTHTETNTEKIFNTDTIYIQK